MPGWRPQGRRDQYAREYPDLETALRGIMAAGPITLAGEEAVRATITDALQPFRTVSGGYVLENALRYLIARRSG